MGKINYWAVIVAVIVTFVASAVWYMMFSHQYFELRGINPNDPSATAMSPSLILVVLVRHLVLALTLAYLFTRLRVLGWKDALRLGVLFWIGLPVVLLAGSVANDKVPLALAAIHGGDWLIKLVMMAIIIGLWRKGEDAITH